MLWTGLYDRPECVNDSVSGFMQVNYACVFQVKGKTKIDDKPPFFDVSMLKSRTVRMLLFSASLSSLGLHTPLIYLVSTAKASWACLWLKSTSWFEHECC